MKKWLITFLISVILFASKVNGQTYTQSFIDKCTGETKIATTTYINGNAYVSFYNQAKVFTPFEVQSGVLQAWLLATKASYEAMTCPVINNPVVQQTVQQTVTQATANVATTAASTAASAAASTATNAASSSTSAAASSSASAATTAPPASSSSSTSTSSSSSESSSSSSSESKSETKSESKSESKSEEKKEESKSESKKEEKKSDSKKEEKKKSQNINPTLLASDLTTAQNPDGRFNVMISTGVSRSSMAGDKSYSANAIIWSTLNQFALSSAYTKMEFDDGKLNAIHSYGVTAAYLVGNYMNMASYTYIKPHPKLGTYGANVGVIGLFLKNGNKGFDLSVVSSAVGFWTKPYPVNKKLVLSPQLFMMISPLSYNSKIGNSTINKNAGFLIGSSFDYKLSRRFGFSFNYKANMNTQSGSPILHNFLIGSRVIL